jgi:hypothetical protein
MKDENTPAHRKNNAARVTRGTATFLAESLLDNTKGLL